MFWGADFALFLPALPAYATVYWWDGVPYYYYDNGYYTWDPSQGGYVATAPPPVTDDSTGTASPDSQQPLQDSGQVYAYPQLDQSPEQQAADRQACEQWASQATANGGGIWDSNDYRRAMVACLMGRGYSVD